jgi:hypothetical protein
VDKLGAKMLMMMNGTSKGSVGRYVQVAKNESTPIMGNKELLGSRGFASSGTVRVV